MAKFFSLAGLAVIGIIIADIVAHGTEAASAATGVATIEDPVIAGLLGTAP